MRKTTNKRAIDCTPVDAVDTAANDLTPAEIRGVLFELGRRQIDERAARPAIAALNRIMRDSTRTLLPQGAK
jgi:hypothetical protein